MKNKMFATVLCMLFACIGCVSFGVANAAENEIVYCTVENSQVILNVEQSTLIVLSSFGVITNKVEGPSEEFINLFEVELTATNSHTKITPKLNVFNFPDKYGLSKTLSDIYRYHIQNISLIYCNSFNRWVAKSV